VALHWQREVRFHLNLPVYNTVREAVAGTAPDVHNILFHLQSEPMQLWKLQMPELNSSWRITEGIQVSDMVLVKEYLKSCQSRLIGPNCPWYYYLQVNQKVVIMPGFIHKKGTVGINIFVPGTLTYEAVDQVTRMGLGQIDMYRYW